MPNQVLIDVIHETGRLITAILLDMSTDCRKERFDQRHEQRLAIARQMSVILGFNLLSLDFDNIRRYCTDPKNFESIPPSQRQNFLDLMRELWLLGAYKYKGEFPDPLDFQHVDYVVPYNETTFPTKITSQEIDIKRIPFGRYANERSGRPIQLCIWDIGNVVYRVSLSHLFDLTKVRSKRPELVSSKAKNFSFDRYMKGEWSFTQLCRHFCEVFEISHSDSLENEVAEALRMGVKETIQESRTVMQIFKEKGVTNAILSNALPILEEGWRTGSGNDIPEELQFLSFQIGQLKPDRASYEHVLRATGVSPDDALFIDDKGRNILGATRVGIAGVLFKPEDFLARLDYQLFRTKLHR